MGIDFTNFQQVFNWVTLHGYGIIFLVMCAEGPMITAAAGFASAVGYFNPWIILILSILGDLVPDTIYYLIGHGLRFPVIERIGNRFGLSDARVVRVEKLLEKNFNKAMITLKLTPVAAVPGFMVVGYLKMAYGRFMLLCSAVTIPKAIIFLLMGYYFGRFYSINKYLHNLSILLPSFLIFSVIIYVVYEKVTDSIAKKIEKSQV